jgi:hypothetical protein
MRARRRAATCEPPAGPAPPRAGGGGRGARRSASRCARRASPPSPRPVLGHQPLVRARLVDRVQVGADYVLGHRERQRVAVPVAHLRGHLLQLRLLRRPRAALAPATSSAACSSANSLRGLKNAESDPRGVELVRTSPPGQKKRVEAHRRAPGPPPPIPSTPTAFSVGCDRSCSSKHTPRIVRGNGAECLLVDARCTEER